MTVEFKGMEQAIKVMEDFAKTLVPQEMKLFGDALAMDLGRRIVLGTPVRGANTKPSRRRKGKRGALQEGGRARGGWQGTVGTDGSGETGRKDKAGNATLAAGNAQIAGRPFNAPFTWYNNVSYILILEEGRVEGKPARGSLQAPNGMVGVAIAALAHVKASEILQREFVATM